MQTITVRTLRPALYTLVTAVFFISAVAFAVPARAAGVVEADDDSYKTEVSLCKLPVVLEFYADWCSYCRKVAPEVDKLASELKGRVKVVRINVDKSPNTTSKFNVRPIPAFFYLEGGSVKGEALGAMSKDQLISTLGIPAD